MSDEEEQKESCVMDLKRLQKRLPWGAHGYTKQFNECNRTARDFEHAVIHVMKAAGDLARCADKFEHYREDVARNFSFSLVEDALADLVICALRAGNVFPGRPIDIALAVQRRLLKKHEADTVDEAVGGLLPDP